jgi:tRNA pseudouridine38-40 synthase
MTVGVVLKLAYDGGPFAGYALQANARSVAGELQGAIWALDPKASLLRGTSRTDSGVHARCQIVSFDSEKKDINPRGWVLGLTRHLPSELAVVGAARAEAGYDPRGHVVSKTYRYSIFESPVRDPFLEGRVWRVYERLNHLSMQVAASHLIGEHDFAAYRGAADSRQETVRRLFRVELRRARTDDRILEIIVAGDRFLYRMVRIIAGTLVDVGRGRIKEDATARALLSKDRRELGVTAPPAGLCLDEIVLDTPLEDEWPG